MATSILKPPPALGRLLNVATAACNAMCQDMLEPHGLSLPQWVILSVLWRKDGLLVSEIAEYTDNNPPAVSRIIDRMTEKGLVMRDPDREDRRSVHVSLTEKGKGLRHLQDFWLRVNQGLLAGVGPAQADALFATLQQVADNARAAREGSAE